MRIITCRGIAEGTGRNMLSPVVDMFPDTEHIELDWSATYGPFNEKGNAFGMSFKNALRGGETKLRSTLDTSRDGAIVLGFSGGAALAGNVASFGHPNLVAVGLVADPFAPEVNGLSGLAGQRQRRISVPAIWKRDPKDVITNARKLARLRYVADASEAFSLGDLPTYLREVAEGKQTEVISDLIRQRWAAIARNPWQITKLWTDFDLDISDAEGYLFRGDHTGYGRRREPNGRTYIEDLGVWVAQQKHLYEKELVRR